MKTFYYFPAIVIASVCFIASCTKSSNYESVITNYILKSNGQKAKFSAKVHSINDLGRMIIIDDNVNKTNQTETKSAELSKLEGQLTTLQDELFKLEVDENGSGREIMETYITKISNLQQEIEYLKEEGIAIDSIEAKAGAEITAVVVRCKYSIIYIGMDKEEIITKNFVVSEDGQTCYGLVDDFVEVPK
ncbi:MAG: hypothetical protein ACK5KT_17605 [Dysgonomonas sp.]